MCLAIPARVEDISDDNMSTVSVLGVKKDISIDLTPDVKVGDYVLVHAGFAIEIVDEKTASETLDLVKNMPNMADIC